MVRKTAYRIITDEPQGICVGFKPKHRHLDEENLDRIKIVDAGGGYVFCDDDGN